VAIPSARAPFSRQAEEPSAKGCGLEDLKAQKGENMFELQIAAGAQGSFICIHEDNIIIICMPQTSI
jgi:hypothetical protein